MKAEQFTNYSLVEMWLTSRLMEYLAQQTNGNFAEILILMADE